MQQLEVNLTIPIPEDQVLISKIELQNLKERSLTGVYWSMKDLEERTTRSSVWICENILYVPKFKKELEKFVHYPNKGGKWVFQASKMAKFLDDNFNQIFNGR